MIAGLGYVVFAEDIFGKGIVPKTVPEMMGHDRDLRQGPCADACARLGGL